MVNFPELDPNMVWKKEETKKEKTHLTGSEVFKPWTDLRQFPEYSYQTSYKTAFPVNYISEKTLQPKAKKEAPVQEPKYKYELYRNQYKTNYQDTYTFKVIKADVGEKPSYITYLDSLREKLRLSELCIPPALTEYTKNFQMHVYDSSICGVIKDQKSQTRYDGPTLLKGLQPFFDPNDGGIRREKDIYISQTHYAHHYFNKESIQKAKESVISTSSKIKIYEDPHPIDAFMRLPFRQVNLLEKTYAVPHRGTLSETKERYRPQVDIFHEKGLELEMSPGKMKINKKDDMIKKMDSFHTEYDHLGHNWNTQNI